MDNFGMLSDVFTQMAVGIVVIFYFTSLYWAYDDARKRGRNSIKVLLLVAILAWPLSIIVWLFMRPRTKRKRRSNRSCKCQSCGRGISTMVVLCPYCGKPKTNPTL
ncbi:MAG: hypothetical protein ABI443_03135 [Chthoniobacterales bacterium]